MLSDTTVVVAAAFLLMGFAMSAAGPAGFSLVEGTSEDPSAAITAVATVGYTGFVWSPPLLGWIADTVDLRAAMAVIVFATLGITITGFFARQKTAEEGDPVERSGVIALVVLRSTLFYRRATGVLWHQLSGSRSPSP